LVTSSFGFVLLQLNRQISNAPFNKGPWITWYDDPATTVCVSWEHEVVSGGLVYYRTAAESEFTQFVEDTSLAKIHHVNITGLQPDTLYYYRIHRGSLAESVQYTTGQFKTAPADANSEAFFALISDTQQPSLAQGGHWQLANIFQSKIYDFVGIIGDLVNDGLRQDNYNDFFAQGAPYLNQTALVPVIGNHDYGSHSGHWTPSNNSLFFKYFPNAANNSDRNFFYYSFNYSAVHVSVCHLTYNTWYDEFTGEQEAWIREDLARAQSMPFRIMLFHCPVIASGFFGKNAILWEKLRPILYEFNVTATISGHEHVYERGFHTADETQPNPGHRVLNLIIGGGGSFLNVASRPHPDLEDTVLTVTNFYTEVRVNATRMQFQTFTVEGKLLDEIILQGGGI
jgi:hypothetical protein